MKTISIEQIKQQNFFKINKKLLFKLTIGGCVVFWLTTIVTSLLPIAAEYRAAFSNWSLQSVWVGSLFMGVILGYCLTYLLLRFYTRIPAKDPIFKSVILSLIALVTAVILLDLPMFLRETNPSLYYFFIGVMFNTVRFLLLGIVVGILYKRSLQDRGNFPKWAANLYARNARRPNGVLSLSYSIIADDIDVRDATSVGKVLDVGCGPGRLSLLVASQMEAVEIIGLDLSPSMVEIASKAAENSGFGNRLRFIEGNVLSIPFPDSSFDTVISSFSLHEWPSVDIAIGEILRVLKKGGRALLFSSPSDINKAVITRLNPQFGWFDANFMKMITGACKKAWTNIENYIKTLDDDVISSSVVISGFIQKLSIMKR